MKQLPKIKEFRFPEATSAFEKAGKEAGYALALADFEKGLEGASDLAKYMVKPILTQMRGKLRRGLK